jgi:GT2 family glycosyltransferase
MNSSCEIKSIKIYSFEDNTVLCLSGSFAYEPGNMRIKAIVNHEKEQETYASIIPEELKGEAVRHNFEIEWKGLDKNTESLLLVLKDSLGNRTELVSMNSEDIKNNTVNSSVITHVDSCTFNKNKIATVLGWAYSLKKEDVEFEIVDTETNSPVELSLRRMLQQRMEERHVVNADSYLCGFMISFEGDQDKHYQLVARDSSSRNTTQLDPVVVKYIDTVEAAFSPESRNSIFKMINMDNIHRGFVYLRKHGFVDFLKRIPQGISNELDCDYDSWFRRNCVSEDELENQRNTHFSYEPMISILVPTYNTPAQLLHEMIHSVLDQTYSNWNLCIADSSKEDSFARKIIMDYQKQDSRIHVTLLDKNYGISGNTNKALEMSAGEYTALFDHDDLLEPNTLFEIVSSLQNVHHDVVYTDEDKLNDETGKFEDPNFKPDYNPDLLLSHNYITHFFVVKTSIIKGVGGFDSTYDGAQDYDVIFKCIEQSKSIYHISKSLYHWRMHKGSTALDPESKTYCYEAGQKAIYNHLKRIGVDAKVELQPKPRYGLYHVIYNVPDSLVSIIIPNKDHADILKKCLNSLFIVNSYSNIEVIIVENGSTNPKTFEYYKHIQDVHKNIKVVNWVGKEFNYSALNNFGARYAEGDYLLFLNNDTEMIKADSLSEMVGLCTRNDVGVVGAKLLYADNTIQHAGVIVGFSGYAGHVFNGLEDGIDYGYRTRDILNCDLSAVTGACLMTKKSVFDAVGGFDEEFKVACNDIDYCMKVVKSGKHVVYNAFSLWHHYESKSRGYENGFDKISRFDKEVSVWQKKWMEELLQGDPAYNRNFKIEDGPFILR